MASGWTTRGAYLALTWAFPRQAVPTGLYLALTSVGTPPDRSTNTLSQLSEIAAGNGYVAGGAAVLMNATDFDTRVEDDAAYRAYVRLKDMAYVASGGSIPASGSGIRYAVLVTDEATAGNRQVIHWWDLGTEYGTIPSGETLRLVDLELGLTAPDPEA
jgi:hypothetical protein